jgi:hypothetical protein
MAIIREIQEKVGQGKALAGQGCDKLQEASQRLKALKEEAKQIGQLVTEGTGLIERGYNTTMDTIGGGTAGDALSKDVGASLDKLKSDAAYSISSMIGALPGIMGRAEEGIDQVTPVVENRFEWLEHWASQI